MAEEMGSPFEGLKPEDIVKSSPEDSDGQVLEPEVSEPEEQEEEVQEEPEAEEEIEETEEEESQEEEESEEAEEEVEEEPQSEEEDDVYSEEEYYASLSESLGEEVASEQELVEKYTQLKRELEEIKSKDPLESLSPLAKDVDRAEKAGMDVNTYLAARNADFDKMEGENLLWEKFKLDNPSMMSEPEYAREKFKRQMQADYGSLSKPNEDDFDDPADYRQALSKYESEKDYAEKSKNFSIKQAREELKKWQADNVTIPEAKESEPAGLSQEEVEANIKKYDESVSQVLDEYNGFALDISGEEFGYELGDDVKKSIEQRLRNPSEFLRDTIGIDLESNSFPDLEKMTKAAMVLEAFENGDLVDQMKTWVLEKFNKDTVTSKRENPRPKDKSIPSTGSKPKTLAEQIAAEFKSQRAGS